MEIGKAIETEAAVEGRRAARWRREFHGLVSAAGHRLPAVRPRHARRCATRPDADSRSPGAVRLYVSVQPGRYVCRTNWLASGTFVMVMLGPSHISRCPGNRSATFPSSTASVNGPA